MTLRHVFLAATIAAGATASEPARASDWDLELAARVGGGAPEVLPGPSPLAVGLGIRAGVVWRERLYFGAAFTDYFGESAPEQVGSTFSCWQADNCAVAKVSESSMLYGLETGYDFKLLNIVTVRPGSGIGYMTISTSSLPVGTVPASRTMSSYLYLEPGLTVLVALGDGIFVGADGNALWLASDVTASVVFTGHAQVGVKF